MPVATVVIIERADAARSALAERCTARLCKVIGADNLFTGWRLACCTQPRLVIVGATGADESLLAQFARELDRLPDGPAIIFLTDSTDPSSTELALERAAEHLHPETTTCRSSAGIIGDSALMQQARAYVQKVAQTSCPVLIMGETGTGKELVARGIHESSARAGKPFVALNCASIPDSLFESEMFGHERGAFTGAWAKRVGRFAEANGGTLFLDEIGELSPYAQAKLLRVLESKLVEPLGGQSKAAAPINVRFVAATNRPLEDSIKTGAFRADLFYRLAVTRLELAPLRKRVEDIPTLLRLFVDNVNFRLGRALEGFDDDSITALCRHTWPGNVRELKNLVDAVAVEKLSGKITIRDMPHWFLPHADPTTTTDTERATLVAMLEQTHWNKSRTAGKLGWSRMKLYRKLAWHGLKTAEAPAPKRDVQPSSEPHSGSPLFRNARSAG